MYFYGDRLLGSPVTEPAEMSRILRAEHGAILDRIQAVSIVYVDKVNPRELIFDKVAEENVHLYGAIMEITAGKRGCQSFTPFHFVVPEA